MKAFPRGTLFPVVALLGCHSISADAPAPETLVGIEVIASTQFINTRETVTFTVEGSIR